MRDGLMLIVILIVPTWIAGMFAIWRNRHMRQTTAARIYLGFITALIWGMLILSMISLWSALDPPF